MEVFALDANSFPDVGESMFESNYQDLSSSTAALGREFDLWANWWVAEHPPPFAPRAASVAEGVLHVSEGVLALLDSPGVRNLHARCHWAIRHFQPLDTDALEGALRCEVAAMSRRPSPDTSDNAFWERVLPAIYRPSESPGGVTFRAGPPTSADVRYLARVYARRRLPEGWEDLAEEERVRAILDPAADPVVASSLWPIPLNSLSSLPAWRAELKILTYRGKVARHYQKKWAPNQARLLAALEEAGWPTKGVVVPELGPDAVDDAVSDFNSSVRPGTIRLFRQGTRTVGWRRDVDEGKTDNRS
jgi:hypothetical protein